MRGVTALDSIVAGEPDDLFVTCASFEDRCLGVKYVGERYNAHEVAIIRFTSSRRNTALDKLRSANLDSLREYLSVRSSKLSTIETERHNPFALAVDAEAKVRSWYGDGLRVTVDISCFTRIQLLFILKHFLSLPGLRLRLLYSKASYYASLERRELGFGYDRILMLPFHNANSEGEPLMQERVLFASLGHEGGRALNAWRFLDPKLTVLFVPQSRGAPDLMAVTERQNRLLLNRVTIEDPGFQGSELPATDIAFARKSFGELLKGFEDQPVTRTVYFTPGGPKPVAAGFALAALRSNISIFIVDPIPTDYNPGYSVGFEGMLQYTIRANPARASERVQIQI